ncbi:hypothetical protein M0802_000794 [Mischocyttarus mexicanus]|nr:hypothetical protein M0802_000794 [Mischocyttarus mexicanus]
MRGKKSIGNNTTRSVCNLESSLASSLGRRDYHSIDDTSLLEDSPSSLLLHKEGRIWSSARYRKEEGEEKEKMVKEKEEEKEEKKEENDDNLDDVGLEYCLRSLECAEACRGSRPGPRPLPIPSQYTCSYDFAPLRRLYVYDDDDDDDNGGGGGDDDGEKKKGGRDEPRELPLILEDEKDSLTVSGL